MASAPAPTCRECDATLSMKGRQNHSICYVCWNNPPLEKRCTATNKMTKKRCKNRATNNGLCGTHSRPVGPRLSKNGDWEDRKKWKESLKGG